MGESLGKTLTRVHISSRDFKRAREFIECARKHPENAIEHEAALLSAIIHYARPFTDNEGRVADPPADRKLAGIDFDKVLGADSELHERILRLRNKVVAHAESASYPVEGVAALVTDTGVCGLATVSRSWHVVNERLDLDAFERIATALAQHCLNRVYEIRRPATAVIT